MPQLAVVRDSCSCLLAVYCADALNIVLVGGKPVGVSAAAEVGGQLEVRVVALVLEEGTGSAPGDEVARVAEVSGAFG